MLNCFRHVVRCFKMFCSYCCLSPVAQFWVFCRSKTRLLLSGRTPGKYRIATLWYTTTKTFYKTFFLFFINRNVVCQATNFYACPQPFWTICEPLKTTKRSVKKKEPFYPPLFTFWDFNVIYFRPILALFSPFQAFFFRYFSKKNSYPHFRPFIIIL